MSAVVRLATLQNPQEGVKYLSLMTKSEFCLNNLFQNSENNLNLRMRKKKSFKHFLHTY